LEEWKDAFNENAWNENALKEKAEVWKCLIGLDVGADDDLL